MNRRRSILSEDLVDLRVVVSMVVVSVVVVSMISDILGVLIGEDIR